MNRWCAVFVRLSIMHQDSKHTVTAAAIAGPSAVVSASAVVVAAPTITTNSGMAA